MNVGFVGIGNMGFGMAENILKAGYTVSAYDLNPTTLERFQAIDGRVCKSNAELAASSDVIFVMTMNGQQAESAMFGENGLCSEVKDGCIIVVTASCGTAYIKKLGRMLPPNVYLIDCPVTGGQRGSNSGTLTLMASGNPDAFKKIHPVLECCSSKIYYCGTELGDGQNAKSCNQLITGITYVATAEALALAVKVGLDPELVTSIIGDGIAGSDIFRTVANNTMERKFENSGANILTMYKDMGIVMDIAKEYEIPLFLTSHVNEYFRTAWARNRQEDAWAITKVTEELCGVTIEKGL